MLVASVNKIINFSNVDGPHNRTSIFFQGCNLNCLFCHNPETINFCLNCGDCVKTCPSKALKISKGKVLWDPEICIDCDQCIKTCKHNSSPKILKLTVDDLIKRIKKTAPYIDGITVSGGECTLHHEFLTALFKEVKKLGLTCFVDSNGTLDFSKYPELLKYTDKVMLDVKAYDQQFHQWLVKYHNDQIIENLSYLLSQDKLYEVRTIIFEGFDEANEYTVSKVASIIKDNCYYKLIKYRPFGVREENLKVIGENEVSDDYLQKYIDLAKKNGATKIIKV